MVLLLEQTWMSKLDFGKGGDNDEEERILIELTGSLTSSLHWQVTLSKSGAQLRKLGVVLCESRRLWCKLSWNTHVRHGS